jgi:hypothetical protein
MSFIDSLPLLAPLTLRYLIRVDIGMGFMREEFLSEVPYASGDQISWRIPSGDDQWDLVPCTVLSCAPRYVPLEAPDLETDTPF